MENYSYFFEFRDIITQFIAAIDGCVIKRYNAARAPQQHISPRYVLAPKQRVVWDIVNAAHNITLPVIAFNVTGFNRAADRAYNKIPGYTFPKSKVDTAQQTIKYNTPAPVDITVNMSILCKSVEELDQIAQNFVVYANPAIVITWKVPDAIGLDYDQEIRSKVQWSGSFNYEYPLDLDANKKYEVIGNTTFTIQGWLFTADNTTIDNIFYVRNNFHLAPLSSISLDQSDYPELSGMNLYTEYADVSGFPQITNVRYRGTEPRDEVLTITHPYQPTTLLLLGKHFDFTRNVILSSADNTIFPSVTSFSYSYHPTVSGYVLPASAYNIIDKNYMTVTLPLSTIDNGSIDIIVENIIGWQSTITSQGVSIGYSEVII